MELHHLAIVTPDWLPLAMAIGLLVLLGLLYLGMRHSINRIRFSEPAEPGDEQPTH
ncbi:MAG TPA: hypothetical protein PLE12_07095 [Propionicimonas sp.]|jgi:acyl dehydratase|nr:hypothetical protein [Propionicimonas sp.]